MKRLIPMFVILLALASAPAFALDTRASRSRHSMIDDVIRMSRAGVSDDAIISYVLHSRDDFEVTADDVIAMTSAHVSKEVVKAVVDEAAARKDDDRKQVETPPAESDPYLYPFFPYYYYDPYWYMPHYYTAAGHPVPTSKEAAREATHSPGSRTVPDRRGIARPRSR